jgi:hypothetical protein
MERAVAAHGVATTTEPTEPESGSDAGRSETVERAADAVHVVAHDPTSDTQPLASWRASKSHAM